MSASSPLSFSQSSAGVARVGKCSICYKAGLKLTSAGFVVNHGPRGAQCQGVGKPPAPAFNFGASSVVPPTVAGSALHLSSATQPSAAQSNLFTSSQPSSCPPSIGQHSAADDSVAVECLSSLFGAHIPTIKWIPRSARQQCATLLTKLLLAVAHNPHSIPAWMGLLSFGKRILHKPQRGSAHRNLFNIAIRRCKDFSSTSLIQAVASLGTSGAPASRSDKRKLKENKANEKGHLQLANAVSAKLEEGNYKGAVRLVCSDEVHAPQSVTTLQALRLKHPNAPSDRRSVDPPEATTSSVTFDDPAVRAALLSFPPGSTAGPDGLTPQHLRDMVAIERGSNGLLSAISVFLGIVVGGSVPAGIRPLFFGGRLLALLKKDGGLRPIAVGLTLRRLAAKIVNKTATESLIPILAPIQLGVGVRGGMEAAVHAARLYVQDMPSSNCVLAKLDFKNAFNTIRRDTMLEAVQRTLPEAYGFVHAAYSTPSTLFYGSDTISSEEGVQQGDPLGPLLFCLALHPILTECKAELRAGYLDDITLGGDVNLIGDEVDMLKTRALKIGLALNENKCELIMTHPPTVSP